MLGAMRVDRLTGPALSGFVPERCGWPAYIGVIAVLEGPRPSLAEVQRHIAARLHRTPRLRQVVHRPKLGLGRPIWVDYPHFDIRDHVHIHLLHGADLLGACEELRQRPLEESRPLWQMWLLPGLEGGRTGLFVKVHHAIADGVAGVALLRVLEPTPDARPDDPPQWTPAPRPSRRVLFLDNLRRYGRGLRTAASRMAHPIAGVAGARRGLSEVRDLRAARSVRRTSLNQRVGGARRMAVVQASLPRVRRAAHEAGASVNDVVLAAVAGALRDLLISRGECVDGLALRAMVPVALHGGRLGPARDNLHAVMLVWLPVGEPDIGRRMRSITTQTARRKKRPGAAWGTGLLGSVLLQRVMIRFADRQRIININVSNVPGPTEPLYLAGTRVIQAFPVVPLAGNVTVGVGVLSYCGQLAVTVVGDRQRCPDLAILAAALDEALDDLSRAGNVAPVLSNSTAPAPSR
jgi:diacylglycerol O-acyltransferase / wax synthase